MSSKNVVEPNVSSSTPIGMETAMDDFLDNLDQFETVKSTLVESKPVGKIPPSQSFSI